MSPNAIYCVVVEFLIFDLCVFKPKACEYVSKCVRERLSSASQMCWLFSKYKINNTNVKNNTNNKKIKIKVIQQHNEP